MEGIVENVRKELSIRQKVESSFYKLVYEKGGFFAPHRGSELFADGSLDRVAVPFKHQYTKAGLDPKALKGIDRSRRRRARNGNRFYGQEFRGYGIIMTL